MGEGDLQSKSSRTFTLGLDMETAAERTHGQLHEHDCANPNEWKVLGVHDEGML